MDRLTTTDGRGDFLLDDDGTLRTTNPQGQGTWYRAIDTFNLLCFLLRHKGVITSGAVEEVKHVTGMTLDDLPRLSAH